MTLNLNGCSIKPSTIVINNGAALSRLNIVYIASMVKLADTTDLKSVAFKSVSVQIRLLAPYNCRSFSV